jgi:hypothetical protein
MLTRKMMQHSIEAAVMFRVGLTIAYYVVKLHGQLLSGMFLVNTTGNTVMHLHLVA